MGGQFFLWRCWLIGLETPVLSVAYGWMAAALVLVTLLTIQGLGFLRPVNVFVCMELQRANPNMTKIADWMQRYFYVVAMQGIMQVAIIDTSRHLKAKFFAALRVSAFGTKPTSRHVQSMSAFGGKADSSMSG